MKKYHFLSAPLVLLCLFFLGVAVFGNASSVSAQYVPLAPIDTGNPESSFTGCSSEETDGVWNKATQTWGKSPSCLPKYLRTIYTTGVILAGLLAVFSIVRGGFTLLYTDSILGHSEAKGIILRAVGGVLIVYSSYVFLNLINPQLASDLNLGLIFPRIAVTYKPVSGIDNELIEIEKQIALGEDSEKLRKKNEALEKEVKAGTITQSEYMTRRAAIDLEVNDQVIKNATFGMTQKYSKAKDLLKSGASKSDIAQAEEEMLRAFTRHARVATETLEAKIKLLDPTGNGQGTVELRNEVGRINEEQRVKREALVNFIAYRKKCPYDFKPYTPLGKPDTSLCANPPVLPLP